MSLQVNRELVPIISDWLTLERTINGLSPGAASRQSGLRMDHFNFGVENQRIALGLELSRVARFLHLTVDELITFASAAYTRRSQLAQQFSLPPQRKSRVVASVDRTSTTLFEFYYYVDLTSMGRHDIMIPTGLPFYCAGLKNTPFEKLETDHPLVQYITGHYWSYYQTRMARVDRK